jgi:hypothetical protein
MRKALPEMRIRSSWDAPFKLASLVWVVSGSCALGIAVSSPQFIIVPLVISGYLVGRFPDLYINELHPHAQIHKFERFPAVTSVRLRLKAYYKYTTTDLKQHRRSKDWRVGHSLIAEDVLEFEYRRVLREVKKKAKEADRQVLRR